ncbi:MAG: RNA 2',3'-cyclic phosphodiesterase [Pseudomonadota bacterium]
MPRVFFGLEVPDTVKKRLLALQGPVKGAKWQSRNQLHLTLAFIGKVDEAAVPDLCQAASRVEAPAFELEAVGLHTFGRAECPRNLWAGVSHEQPLLDLQRQLSDQLARAGFDIGQSNFQPHITVARFRKQAGSVARLLQEHGDDRFGSFPVTGFVLFESTPGATGSVYTVIERFPLPRRLLDETPQPDQ